MRRERVEPPKPQGAESAVDNLLWLAVGTALAATVLVWVVGQVAAVLFGTHHWLPLNLGQVAQVPFHLANIPATPSWPGQPASAGCCPARSACTPPWSWSSVFRPPWLAWCLGVGCGGTDVSNATGRSGRAAGGCAA
jgi:hypothetical protein